MVKASSWAASCMSSAVGIIRFTTLPMNTIRGNVLEVSHDYEGIFHVTLEANIPDSVVLIRFDLPKLGKDPHVNIGGRMSGEPTRLIVTTVGEPDLRAGDSIAITVFYQDDVILKDGRPVPIAEAHDFPNPNAPTHVVQMGTPASPEWARPEKWTEVIRRLFVPCKEHGIHPVPGNQFLTLRNGPLLGIGNITVHCPNQGCKYYAGDYTTGQWNALMKQES